MAFSIRPMRSVSAARPGFTLIELLVVIAIIALLASLVLVNLNGYQGRAKVTKATSDLSQVANAVALLRQDTGVWPYGCDPNYGGDIEGPLDDTFTAADVNVPPGQAGLLAKPTNTYTTTNVPMLHAYGTDGPRDYCLWTDAELSLWQGPYIASKFLLDPWGHGYYLDRDAVLSPTSVAVESLGPDGSVNNSDDILMEIPCGNGTCPFATYNTNQIPINPY